MCFLSVCLLSHSCCSTSGPFLACPWSPVRSWRSFPAGSKDCQHAIKETSSSSLTPLTKYKYTSSLVLTTIRLILTHVFPLVQFSFSFLYFSRITILTFFPSKQKDTWSGWLTLSLLMSEWWCQSMWRRVLKLGGETHCLNSKYPRQFTVYVLVLLYVVYAPVYCHL